MEFKIMPLKFIHFNHIQSPVSKKAKLEAKTKAAECINSATFSPVFVAKAGDNRDLAVNWKSSRDISIAMLFGESALAKKLKVDFTTYLAANLTITSSNIGILEITNRRFYPFIGVDILQGLFELQERVPPNSIEFILQLKDFHNAGGKEKNRVVDFQERGLKLSQNESGMVSLQMTNIHFSENIWWKEWNDESDRFYGWLGLSLKLDNNAVAELYMKCRKGLSSQLEFGSGTDILILVGGNKDKENGFRCHKSILSEVSPVFAAMFKADMLEANQNTLEIVDFSESVISALIRFVYTRNVKQALESSDVCLELLQVADKYEIKELRDILLHIIWYKPFEWFSVEKAILLVCYTGYLGEDLAQADSKGWDILKWISKEYPEKLTESKAIENLCNTPETMKQLVLQLLSRMK